MLTEALIGAVTEAVIERVANIAGLEDRLRHWLRRDPARLAFGKAFTRAYTAFARQYPDLDAALFDEHFLTTQAAPELAKLLTRNQHPDPATLATLWQQQFTIQTPLITPAAGHFLHWLEAELKGEEVFQPIFDSRALETLPALETKFDELVRVLKQQAAQALQYASRYDIHTDGGSYVQGDVQASTFIGRDQNIYNTYFQGAFATLDDYYVRPDAVYQRVKVEDFVGRTWLAAKVDDFLNTPGRTSGALVLVGEAGVGKTSFLAHLVKERRYLHLFGEQLSGEAKLPVAIRSLAAQLIARYRIEPYARRDAMPDAPSFYSPFLERLLRQAADTLAAGEQIVIVCDALDEAGAPPGDNVFGLPKNLPNGVFLILSQRPVPVPLTLTYPPTTLKLEAGSQENIADVEAYLAAVARRPAIAQQLRAHHYSEADFVRTLAAKSAGVWMYLLYVIDEIEQGERAPLNLEQLPTGLAGYYAQYWRRWRNPVNQHEADPKWDSLYAPLLGALAAAQEPVSLARLVAWAGVPATPTEVRRLLGGQWRAFISDLSTDAKGETRYRLYHLSLRDFITGRVKDNLPPGDDHIIIDELREQVAAAHHRIVAQYRAQCEGHWATLAPLDDYARTYLVTHLHAVEPQTMFDLVAHSDAWAKAREAHEGSYAGFLTDLDLAWQWVESEGQWDLGAQIRCALIKSSIHALASNLPPELIAFALEAKLWSPVRALAHIPQISGESKRAGALAALAPHLPQELLSEALAAARSITDEYWRAEALTALAPHLPQEQRPEVLSEALAAARSLTNEYWRAEALAKLAPHLPQELLSEALAAARSITYEDSRAEALVALAPHLPQELLSEALADARNLTNEDRCAEALAALAPHLPQELLGEALAAARNLTYEDSRAEALAALAPHLPQELLSEALAAAHSITSEYWRARTLAALAPHLPQEQRPGVLSEALAAARSLTNEYRRARALAALAPHLPQEQRLGVLSEALAAARSITFKADRAEVLAALAPHLPQELLGEALAAARSLTKEYWRAEALAKLASRLPQELLGEALAAARSLTDEYSRARALAALAPHLPQELLSEALAAARSLTNEYSRAEALAKLASRLPQELLSEALAAARSLTKEYWRAEALAALAPHLPQEQQPEVLSEALAAARSITDEHSRARALAALAPHLPQEQRPGMLSEALAAARSLTDEYSRAKALAALAPHLSQELLSEALVAARSLTPEYSRAEALAALAPHLPQELLSEALAAARSLTPEYYGAAALAALAPHLPQEQRPEVLGEALAAARSLTHEYWRAEALAALAPHLPQEQRPEVLGEALVAARSLTDEYRRAEALAALAPHLPQELLGEALVAARSLTDEDSRAEALAALAPHLPQEQRPEVLGEALVAARSLTDEYSRAEALAALAPHLLQSKPAKLEIFRPLAARPRRELLNDLRALMPLIRGLGGAQTCGEMLLAIRDVSSWWP